MSATVANALDAVTRLVDKLARDLPRNIDVATLRYYVDQLAAAVDIKPRAAAPLVAALTRKRSRRRGQFLRSALPWRQASSAPT